MASGLRWPGLTVDVADMTVRGAMIARESGLFFGFAFGMGGLGAAVLGPLVDRIGIVAVYQAIAYLPLLGIVAALVPAHQRGR